MFRVQLCNMSGRCVLVSPGDLLNVSLALFLDLAISPSIVVYVVLIVLVDGEGVGGADGTATRHALGRRGVGALRGLLAERRVRPRREQRQRDAHLEHPAAARSSRPHGTHPEGVCVCVCGVCVRLVFAFTFLAMMKKKKSNRSTGRQTGHRMTDR